MSAFNWNNRKQIFSVKDYGWLHSHGQVPYYIDVNGRKKIFFTSRPPKSEDGTYVSYIYSADVTTDGNGAITIRDVAKKPHLELGQIGCFDEFGTMPCSVIKHPEKDEVWLYYVGWSRKVTTPFDCAIGLAVSKDGGNTFTKVSDGPLVGANLYDPFVLGCPRVYRFNNKWYMFYLAGIKWLDFEGAKESLYKLKIATSEDGINWNRNDEFIMPEKYENECQTCATVFEFNGMYHMYFTYRHAIDFRNPDRGYRIGYASSKDLKTWTRNDEEGNFTVSGQSWDNEMVCYPNVNLIDNKLVMLYCGNSFGLHGFGSAEIQIQ